MRTDAVPYFCHKRHTHLVLTLVDLVAFSAHFPHIPTVIFRGPLSISRLGTGKLYHENLPPNGDGARSWSNDSAAAAVQWSCPGTSGACPATQHTCAYCDPDMEQCGELGGPRHERWCANPTHGGLDGYADVKTLRDARIKLGASSPSPDASPDLALWGARMPAGSPAAGVCTRSYAPCARFSMSKHRGLN